MDVDCFVKSWAHCKQAFNEVVCDDIHFWCSGTRWVVQVQELRCMKYHQPVRMRTDLP